MLLLSSLTPRRASLGWSVAASLLAASLCAARGEAQAVAPVELRPFRVQQRPAVEVHFLAYRGENQYAVEAGDRRCTTPCTLVLPPGPTSVRATGSGEFTMQMVLPHLTSQVRLDHPPPSYYLTAGAVLIPSGIVVAGGFWAFGLTCGYSSGSGVCQVLNFVGWPVIGISMLVTGAVLMGLSNRVPAADANRAEILDASARPRVRLTGIAFAPTAEGASGAMSFVF